MKTWIIRQYIALAEAFEWPVPDWVRRWLPRDQVDAMVAAERRLTHALRSDSDRPLERPDNLEFLIESRIAAAPPREREKSSLIGMLVPVSALAAAAVLGLYLITAPDRMTDLPTETVATSQPTQQPVPHGNTNLTTLASLQKMGGQDLLLRPLEDERAKLAADVTAALKYVAQGMVPDPYVEQVNHRLDSFNRELGGHQI